MTLAEMMIAVVLIGLLAALLIPAFLAALSSRDNTVCSRKLLSVVQAFELHAAERGFYPAGSAPGVIPPEMADYYFPYFKIDWWVDPTELGGFWAWDAGSPFRVSVSISAPSKSVQQLTDFDRLIDDGDLTSGNFRQVGSRYHYIIEE